MATWLTRCPASQSDRASRSAVMVENVRTCSTGLPGRSQQRTQTTTLSLWTSMPAQRGYRVSMGGSGTGRAPEDIGEQTLCSACSPLGRGRQFRVRGDVRTKLYDGLAAPVTNAGLSPGEQPTLLG